MKNDMEATGLFLINSILPGVGTEIFITGLFGG